MWGAAHGCVARGCLPCLCTGYRSFSQKPNPIVVCMWFRARVCVVPGYVVPPRRGVLQRCTLQAQGARARVRVHVPQCRASR